jgi:hypothetical protein
VRHVKGKDNAVADWLSRWDSAAPPAGTNFPASCLYALEDAPFSEDLLAKVHGGRKRHHGVRKTYLALNDHFPGHMIPYFKVEDFVAACAICQKYRLGMTDALEPVYRTLKSPNKRKVVGVDTLTVTAVDKFGNHYINVVVVHGNETGWPVPVQVT